MKLDIFGEIVVTLGTTPQGQSHETVASQIVADILGVTPDDVHVRAGHDSYWNTYAGFSGTYASQFAVTGLGAVKGATDDARRPDPAAGRGHPRRRRARRRSCSAAASPSGATTRRPPCPSWRAARSSTRTTPASRTSSTTSRSTAATSTGRRSRCRTRSASSATSRSPTRRRSTSCVLEVDPETGVLRDRRLLRRGRLRQPHPPSDRRGPGARRDRARARSGDVRDVPLRRGRDAPDVQLLRLPRPARARHAAAQDGRDRVALALHAARRRRAWAKAAARASMRSAPRSRTRCARRAAPSSTTATTRTDRVWELIQRPGGEPRARERSSPGEGRGRRAVYDAPRERSGRS